MKYSKWRAAIALLVFLAISLCFLDFTGAVLSHCSWLIDAQVLPACLSLNIFALVILLAATLIWGRVYCSWLCPLGILQDIVARLRGHSVSRHPYHYSEPCTKTRYIILIVFVALIACGLLSVACLIDPYGFYGRIATNLLAPLYITVNNWLAGYSASRNSYTFYEVALRPVGAVGLGLALVSFALIAVLAWTRGRLYCNTICPVGTCLSLVGRQAICKVHFVKDNCVQCGMCAKVCKSGCLDVAHKQADNSRCVVCGHCWETCKEQGIRFDRK